MPKNLGFKQKATWQHQNTVLSHLKRFFYGFLVGKDRIVERKQRNSWIQTVEGSCCKRAWAHANDMALSNIFKLTLWRVIIGIIIICSLYMSTYIVIMLLRPRILSTTFSSNDSMAAAQLPSPPSLVSHASPATPRRFDPFPGSCSQIFASLAP